MILGARFHRPWVSLACIVTLGFGLACATDQGPLRVATDAEQADYDAAIAPLAVQPVKPANTAAAQKNLEAYLRENPASPLADDAAWALHEIAERQGNYGQARHWLDVILSDYPNEDRSDAARLKLASAAVQAGELEEGRNLVRRVRVSRLDDAQRLEILRLQVALSRDPVERLGHLGRLRGELERHATPPGEDAKTAARGDVDRELRRVDGEIALILRGMSAEQLDRAAAGIKKGVPAAAIRIEVAERALDADDLDRAKHELDDADRQTLRPADAERLAELRQLLALRAELAESGGGLPTFADVAGRALPDPSGAEGSIGVVLPLSGRLGAYGRSALQGILLATGVFEREPMYTADGIAIDTLPSVAAGPGGAMLSESAKSRLSQGVRIVVRDSGGDPGRAAAAVRSLARDEDVRAIVGPIFSGECEAAVKAADQANVPILTLSNREEVARHSPWGFRLRTTAHDEVAFLVDYAWNELGARRFAVLYPKNRYGRGMREEYWNDVLERGGIMTAVSSYDPSSTDYADAIRRMVGWELITRNEREMLAARERIMRRARRLEPEEAALLREDIYRLIGPDAEVLPPVVDFDVLFIPDSHKRIEMLAPQLAYHEVNGVRLLGSSDWNDPDLVRIARNHVAGSVISTPFFVDSRFPFVTGFVDEWNGRFPDGPDVFGALGYDAANLLMLQLAGGTGRRDEVRDGLLRVRGYPGVSGVTTMQPDGNARRRPYLLEVKGSRIVGLD